MRRVLFTWLLVLSVLLGSCGGPSPAVSWLDSSAAVHEQVVGHSQTVDLNNARQLLIGALAQPMPGDMSADDSRIVRQDLYFRLASVELEDGAPLEALRYADEGLELGSWEDIFTSNLLVVRGRAARELGQERDAARDFLEAQRISELVLDEIIEAERRGELVQ
jgi:hypothetical protein